MSADVLRQAAAVMRERAEAAIHDSEGATRWTATGDGHHAAYGVTTVNGPLWDIVNDVSGPDAEHIASWHPAVALAVADWLDRVADQHDTLMAAMESGMSNLTEVAIASQTNEKAALAVARAYLGNDQ